MRELRAGEPLAIGRYRIVGVIGAGGMGRVFLGVSPDGRLAAIKQVLSTFAEDPQFRQRFAQEISASRKVSGAFTAALMDADPHAEAPWLASVFVPAPALDTVIRTHGPLPESALWRLTVGLAIALQEIHRVGLIHRDFKPGNVLLTDDGPRVIDFGIAHAVNDTAQRLTQTGAVVGSPAYLSPEQIDNRPLTPASDVFALGAILTYSATGYSAFGDGPVPALIYRIATAEPDLTGVPPDLRPMIAACLDKDPTRRPTTQQLLHHIGPLDPAGDWLPAPVHHMIYSRAEEARRLSRTPTRTHPGMSTDPGNYPGATPDTGTPTVLPGSYTPTPTTGRSARVPEQAAPPAGRPRRARIAATVGAAIGAAAALTAALTLWPAETDPEDAAAFVSAITPTGPPAGFRVDDDSNTPEIDGAPGDPLQIDRSRSYFGCDVEADPPLPAEAGVLAATNSRYREDVGPQPDRFRDSVFYTVAYLDAPHHDTIMSQIRSRIGDCRTEVPVGFTTVRFSNNTLSGADEHVGYIANLPPTTNFAQFPPQVGSCEFARVDAIVVRACALVSNERVNILPGFDSTDAEDNRLRSTTRALLEPLIDEARRQQADE
ncbi:serine/threonine-protein kinase [Pseudonocardia cypriaca]|uniref:Serine/threonine protein kinase n=1 Tax=Pseudonocardia cypriaca TaxID=882449 RepID=A0A543GCM8_9PSEU|nr:serine/threonine-protein kinase [Pseudonocardia cypriaca]TQM43784.1 serine/threonine protein kinase [Pseudonocardia cypriaca]